MLKNQTVNHVSEHLSAICPVYTPTRGNAEVAETEGCDFVGPEGVKPLPYERQCFVAKTEGCVLFLTEGVKPLPDKKNIRQGGFLYKPGSYRWYLKWSWQVFEESRIVLPNPSVGCSC